MRHDIDIQNVVVNGRAYALPRRPVAVVCLDGCDPDYLAVGLAAGELPAFARIARDGFAGEALSALPSFTNPNNCSLVTGVPPAVHGVSGNFYLDRRTGETVMVTGDKELKAPTILAAMAKAGVPTAVVTAKDKLRAALAKGLPIGANGIAISAQHAAAAREQTHGIGDRARPCWPRRSPTNIRPISPSSCSMPACGCWKQGARGCSISRFRTMCSTGYAPEEPEAREFHRAVDARLRPADGTRGGRRRHRRSRHARHGEARWHAQRDLRGRCAGCGVWCRHLPGDLPDHRSLRPPSRRARRLRARPYRPGRSRRCARSSRICPPCRGSSRRWKGRRRAVATISRRKWRAMSRSSRRAVSRSARGRRSMTSRGWRANGCARMAARPSSACRSWSRPR